jgi:hypothetical protein
MSRQAPAQQSFKSSRTINDGQTPTTTPSGSPNPRNTNSSTSDSPLKKRLKQCFDHKISKHTNGINIIDGIVLELLYYSYLASDDKCNNIMNKRMVKKEFYLYILENKLTVIGGKFSKSHAWIRVLYYCT